MELRQHQSGDVRNRDEKQQANGAKYEGQRPPVASDAGFFQIADQGGPVFVRSWELFAKLPLDTRQVFLSLTIVTPGFMRPTPP